MHYPNLKVSPLREDICPLCYKYANRKKFALTPSQLFPLAEGQCKKEGVSNSTEHTQPEEESTKEHTVSEQSGNQSYESKESMKESSIAAEESTKESAIAAGESDRELDGGGDDKDMMASVFGTDSAPVLGVDGVAPFAFDEEMEQMILRAATHVYSARAQRALYQSLVSKAISDTKRQLPHNLCTYTLVVDYGQNMELPVFNSEQPGTTYYYSPLNIYNLGCVNHAHVVDQDHENPREHMHCHIYHEGIAKKGANNVASLIMKTLQITGLLREEECGKELNIIFDNCSGQNKNNTVLKLVPYLVEMKMFKKVIISFASKERTSCYCN